MTNSDTPTCERHGAMVERDTAGQTKEQQWCGTWWDCADPGCRNSVLIPSDELTELTDTPVALDAPVDQIDQQVADQVIVENEHSFSAGRSCARQDITHARVTPVPFSEARGYCAQMLRAGRDSKAAFWLGYADEMHGR